MELNSQLLLLIVFSPIAFIFVILLIVMPILQKANFSKTQKAQKEFKEELERLKKSLKDECSKADIILIKKFEILELIRSGHFKTKNELDSYIEETNKEIEYIRHELRQELHKFFHESQALFKKHFFKINKTVWEESGNAAVWEVLKLNLHKKPKSKV